MVTQRLSMKITHLYTNYLFTSYKLLHCIIFLIVVIATPLTLKTPLMTRLCRIINALQFYNLGYRDSAKIFIILYIIYWVISNEK